MKHLASIFAALLLALPVCGQPGAALDKELHGLRAEVDALTAKVLELQKPRGPYDHIPDLRPNDWTVDNAPVIEAAIEAGIGRFDFSTGGVIHTASTIDLGHKTGLAFVGNGITHWLGEAGYGPKASGSAATRIVYTGPADQPAVIYRGVGLRWEGIVLQRGTHKGAGNRAERDGSIGLQMSRYSVGNPSGKFWMPQAAFHGWDVAFDITGPNNADCSSVGWLRFDDCNTCIRSNNEQAVAFDWGHLVVNGNCDQVFDVDGGGKYSIGVLTLNNKALVFRFRRTMAGSAYYKIGSLFVDANCKGWRLAQQEKPGKLCLKVDGHLSIGADPADDAIQLKPLVIDKREYAQQIDVDLWWNGASWPRDFKKARVSE